jgi:hypothetical protein
MTIILTVFEVRMQYVGVAPKIALALLMAYSTSQEISFQSCTAGGLVSPTDAGFVADGGIVLVVDGGVVFELAILVDVDEL